ncbi:MAG TPA: agmatine deiminase family protein [Nevskiaceae bacterium]|nr:agmatine deiminase family protein [Nevskiaceae bacterium]
MTTATAMRTAPTAPAASSSILPPEWAPQRAVMLTWPRRDGDFGPLFDAVERDFLGITSTLSRFEDLHINVAAGATALREQLLASGIPAQRLHLYELPNDDVWARDHGPITVWRAGRCVHLDFTFNGWGGKFPAARDNASTAALAALNAWPAAVETVDFVLEGGAIDVDGHSSLLTTERCLLAPTRNPKLSRAGIEDVLRRQFGISQVLWLKHGDLLGDDTDGHVDTLARFCNPRTIAWQSCEDTTDAHYAELQALGRELAALRDTQGQRYELVPLPLPAPIHAQDGRRLPAGYANFLIVNGAVLVPAYGDAHDEDARSRLAPHFPGRQLISVNCRSLIEQYGSLHCVTMQLPAAPP